MTAEETTIKALQSIKEFKPAFDAYNANRVKEMKDVLLQFKVAARQYAKAKNIRMVARLKS